MRKNARTTLEKFREAVRENKALRMPASWKCRKCEFRQECISSFG
jgi:CRISPR/Cas system-associated exonuclease Cas4 (RecB family)